MTQTLLVRSTGRALAYGAGIAAGVYATYAATTWLSYGHARPAAAATPIPLLDRFMPVYEVAERHTADHVNAPPDITFAASCDVDLQRSRIIQAIFKGRELALGAKPEDTARPRGLVALTKSLDGECSPKFRAAKSSWAGSRSHGPRTRSSARCRRTCSPHSTNRTMSRSSGRCAPTH